MILMDRHIYVNKEGNREVYKCKFRLINDIINCCKLRVIKLKERTKWVFYQKLQMAIKKK
ncbi:hypothetical protein BUY96_03920 [Staphylococcus gallinarum]|nr:hypothetical protein BUY96_03920 [Staphylococcus gallinarum]